MEESLEQTLHVARAVDVYHVPPRAPNGWHSGEWLVTSKIFSGRLQVVSKGEICEVRLEDATSDTLFACCPISYGMRNQCVQAVADSSRFFVLRVEDATTRRHAFLGMGFTARNDAFDFNEALQRHEKFVERERASQAAAVNNSGGQAAAATSGAGGQARGTTASLSAQAAAKEVAGLYAHSGDLGLKAGQTMHIALKNKAPTTSNPLPGGVPILATPVGAGGLFKLAPPPNDLISGDPAQGLSAAFMQQAPSAAVASPAVSAPDPFADAGLLGGVKASPHAVGQAAVQDGGWAKFD
mmetsp:Transcript_8676/g.14981  ORF Transcript_8676/g.14981 Transcript_8676/m.14981 type:complete len:297 (-) Transcript_8676:585-1475(-)|eukprot:CAMPEP_0119101882 /NCGR_PEP_ID=MMETSP1180-20130426/800_1 /TAXON_ID=3052 ORGANISM="Chlamydomonas cf sp, Strain CCMP681" /NCGR_SAMPLE_ID=MMETSP1180 /ASSEMBLY_ACC=CAM_ASM_000741 /LENGTH=296 /DNA_ID=CAMNT_0007086063 /DNA_START=35 /DNA_END=925 /DNA_ORIENTATION=+